jgi:hypothetical protein
MMSCNIAFCSRVGDRVEDEDILEPGLLIRVDWNEATAFAVDPALAVSGNDREEMGCDNGAVLEGASPLGGASARERLTGKGKNFDALDEVPRAAIGSAREIIGLLSGY